MLSQNAMMRSLALLPFLLLALGCSGSVGPNGDVVGGPRTATSGCAGGSRCLVEGDFPGGSCTIDCDGPSMCPGGSACVEENEGTCLDRCSSDGDCRAGYRCVSKRNLGAEGESRVCLGG